MNPRISVALGQALYKPGETVAGYVLIEVSEAFSFSEVVLKWRGKQTSTIKRTVSEGKKTRTESFEGLEYLFRQEQMVLSGAGGNKLTPGQHRFDFSFILPANLPSSYRKWDINGEGSSLAYDIKAEIRSSSFFKSDLVERREFTVHSVVMANAVPASRHSYDEPNSFFCCGSRGAISWRMELPRDEWQVGEVITGIIRVDASQCKAPIRGLQLELKSIYKVGASSYYKDFYDSHGTNQLLHRIDPHAIIEAPFSFPIESNQMPTLNSLLASYSYQLEASLDIPGSFNPTLSVPVKIRSVLLLGQTVTLATYVPAQVVDEKSQPSAPPAYSSL